MVILLLCIPGNNCGFPRVFPRLPRNKCGSPYHGRALRDKIFKVLQLAGGFHISRLMLL
jgi:hypothetical protein